MTKKREYHGFDERDFAAEQGSEEDEDEDEEQEQERGFHIPHLPHVQDIPIIRKFSRHTRNSL